uniref:Resistant protein n=1 Tax=Oryza sativa subsp. japonica TaxID=39947 RepID=E3WF10_ORYSJ|nr:resistant protein [Oryza sativa Japonica Group]
MTELASGAVSSLLVVIRNEAALLGGVRDDVQFIKEEMESMNSFLAHLAKSAPQGGEHNEQVRTWMNQVRLLAQDCNNCIDLYLYSGNPEIHRAKGRLRRHLWWAYWYLRKMIARHRAAVQLCQLKDRARDVGERRLRYGVEVPATTKAAAPDAASGYAAGDDEDEEDYEHQLAVATAGHHSARRAVYDPPALEDYVNEKLLEWAEEIPTRAIQTLSIAIVAPDTDNNEVLALAHEILVAPGYYYRRSIMVNVPAVHAKFLPLRPKEVLYYILRELEHGEGAGSQKQATDQGNPWQGYYNIYRDKKKVLRKIKRNIEKMNIYKKLEKIESDIKHEQQKSDKQLLLQLQKKGVDQVDLHVLLQLLLLQSQQDQVKNKAADIFKLPEWNDNNIMKIARKLKKHMETDEETKEVQIEVEEETTKQGRRGKRGEDEKQKEKGEERKEVERHKEKEEETKEEEQQHKKQEEKGEEREKVERHEKEKEEETKEEHEEKKEREGREVEDEEEKDNDDNNDGEEEEEEEEEDDDDEDPIHLHEDQYAQILQEVFPKIANSKTQQQDKSEAKQVTKTATTTLDEERIKQMINEAKEDVFRELRGGKPDKNQATCEPDVPPDKNQATGEHAGVMDHNGEAYFTEIEQKIDEIKQEFKKQLKIKGIVDKIKHHLIEYKIKHELPDECPLIILKFDDMMDGSRWEEFRKALSLLECSADALIFTTENTEQAKRYSYPPREPIDYSLVGLYHYTVLELTSKHKNEDNCSPKIFRDILEECEGHEFCMKIFTHALYANPKRSNEELSKLHSTLQDSQKSFDAIAKKMFMYSYNDLPKEYKSCLLYLAIFPKGQKIRRSTLIGRWVAEGLTLKEDWPSSVRQANRCFDALIRRYLVCPVDIGGTGKVKSCAVHDPVHGFITTIARKQHIVETRLSHHLARHFSIFNDLRLRSSDGIHTFFQSLSRSSRVSLLKVLDLEGSQCFGVKNQRYLKDICSKMLLLKYLSLKKTEITQLPSEINCLRELEVLDIRETKVPANATVNVLLLKLKRLLAGHIDSSPRNSGTSVQIPHRIDKMVNIEVLSNVKAQRRDDLEDIGKLWQLRKLGVVVDDKRGHLGNLLKAISNLHECIRSLTITISTTTHKDTPSNPELPDHIGSDLPHPKKLESLSISGARHLFPLLIKSDNNKLAKVTLSSTPLNQDDLEVLAKLPKLQCVRLQHISCIVSELIFKEENFKCLKYLLIEGFNLTNITFEDGSACELEKMVLSSTSIESISGVDVLPKFKELELNNSHVPNEVKEAVENNKRIILKCNEP